jgi:glycosyltransferase involved in cell wall biosynthesis
MDNLELIINGALIIIMLGIFGTWLYLLAYTMKTFKRAPSIKSQDSGKRFHRFPKVSIILPARNEEKYISKCLESLINQDYQNYEIIAVNDSSTDMTEHLMWSYAKTSSRITVINARPTVKGWTGKNWACYEGYQKATGDVFLFTDADTVHSSNLLSLATGTMLEAGLDALTIIPRLLCNDFWTKITLPLLSTFLHTRFSALRVNNPEVKIGYFIGSFYIMTRRAYESVGTHKEIRDEIIEDRALGQRVKEQGLKMKMFRGEDHIEAIWARDLKTLWNGLRRLVIPLYNEDRFGVLLMIMAVFFLLVEPFLFLPYPFLLDLIGSVNNICSYVLFAVTLSIIIVIFLMNIIQLKLALFENPLYAFFSPIGCVIIFISFISSVVDANKVDAISWRNRKYSIDRKHSNWSSH